MPGIISCCLLGIYVSFLILEKICHVLLYFIIKIIAISYHRLLSRISSNHINIFYFFHHEMNKLNELIVIILNFSCYLCLYKYQ